jgi:uncharacterized OB-fold protein
MSTTEHTAPVAKPQPRVTALSRPFWDGANAGRLMLQRCLAPECGKACFYPRVCCPHCQAPELEWFEAKGTGRVISHTTVHRTHHDGFNVDAPYVFAAIAVDEGPCLYAQMPDAPSDGRSLVGATVVVGFVDHGPGRRMAVFRLSAPADAPGVSA